MKIFDRYILKDLSLATLLIGLTLTGVVFLTQSLKFLELVIGSGARREFLGLGRFGITPVL
ncbi:MAG: hypothetical protein LRY36_02565 [Alphaproteobacteria bacterium]|nr:hypothetical protein [Alphaproteobacteria bacterium]